MAEHPDWIVFHEPRVLFPLPDFVLWSPQIGLLLLEVKDYSANHVVQTDPEHWIVLEQSGEESTRPNPAKQVFEAQNELWRRLQRLPELCTGEPGRKGKLRFAINHGVVLPNMSQAEARQAKCLDSLVPKRCAVFFREDLSPGLAEAEQRERFIALLRRRVRFRYTEQTSPEAVDVLRQFLSPSYTNPALIRARSTLPVSATLPSRPATRWSAAKWSAAKWSAAKFRHARQEQPCGDPLP